jgi:ABC-type transport system substrate-binding protein
VFTIRLRPGIYFADDPAVKGQRRELVAQDYVYAIQRMADPANKSPNWSDLEEAGFIGLAEARQEALDKRQPFNYDRPIAGLRALDRTTLRIELKAPRPRLIELLASGDRYGAVAREVVQAYGDQIDGHPVGTGPFRLAQWRRSSLIVLERNPGYRERYYDAEPNADDAEGQALLARFKGRRLPMVDRVEVSIIEEPQPRWLSFLNHQQDFIERVPEEFISLAMPGNRVAPNLAKLGIQGYRTLAPDAIITTYNMDDPVVGGYTPDKVALRRALNLAMNIQREIDLVRRGQGIPAQGISLPHQVRARALLDLYGYVDRDGDGWRDQPNGQPLVLQRNSQPDQQSRGLDDLWVRDMKAIGVRTEVHTAKWPENYKAARAGHYMMWWLGTTASQMDGQSALTKVYGPQTGMGNLARFKNAELDAFYDQMQSLPDGPEREALFRQVKRIAVAYAPYKSHLHRYITDMAQPWLIGFRRPLLWQDWWQYVDIDPAKLPTDLAPAH